MSLQQTFYGVAQPIVNQTNAGVSSLSGSISGNSSSGAGPNLEVSTLTVNDSGNITLDWNNGGGTLNFGFEATNTSSFIIQQGASVQQSRITGPQGSLQFVQQEGSVFGYAPVIASGIEIATGAFPGQASAGLYSGNNTSILYSINQPMLLDAPSVNISSLTVSSINGAVPGGGGAGPNPVVSSLTLPPYQGPQTGSIAFSGGMAITELTASPNYPEYFFDPQKPTSGAYDLVSTFASSITTLNIASPVATSATLNLAAGNNGNCMIFMNDPISTLALVANPVVIPGNLVVSSINGALPASNITNQYTANSVSSIGGLPIYNSQVARVGKLQTVQFNFVYASTISGSNAGFIDMIASAMAPGNWLWQAPPSVVLNGIKTGSAGIPIGVNAQLTGDPGDLSQELTLSFQFADSNIAQNVLCTMTGIAYN